MMIDKVMKYKLDKKIFKTMNSNQGNVFIEDR